jgi:hypothetical protein
MATSGGLGVLTLPAAAATYYVSPAGNDSNSGTSGSPWRSLQKAAATMVAGDTTLVADGDYPGNIVQTRSGSAVAPITYRAINRGVPVVRGDQTTVRDAIYVTEADYIVFEGLTVRNSVRAGMRISLSNHVTARHCRFLNNGTWGVFTDYSDDTVLEHNECAGSGREHGIYISNGSDRPVLRFNNCHDNNACGIQINADPDFVDPAQGTRGDGITEHALVEGNVCYNNGTAGGAAINLASVRSSRIVNNLLYNNKAGGLVGWDNGAGDPWGSKNNVFLHNTVYFRPGEGRWCLSLKNGSTGNVAQNNILHGGARGAIELDNGSSVSSDYNVLRRAGSAQIFTNEDTAVYLTLAQWRSASGNDLHSTDADPLFASPASASFDFHPRSGSPALDAGVDRPDVTTDLEGTSRPQFARWDLGCYERGGAAPAPTPTPAPAPTPTPTPTPPPTPTPAPPPAPAPTPAPTPAPALQPPTNLTATVGRRQVALSWTQSPSANIVRNRIYRASNAAGPYRLLTTVSARTRFVDSSRTSFGAYYYRVTAIDATGRESAPSNTASSRAR